MIIAMIAPGAFITLLGVCYWFIPAAAGERSGFMATIILTEVMFLVMLTSFLPISKEIPRVAYLFPSYVCLLVILSGFVLMLERSYLATKELFDLKDKKKEAADKKAELEASHKDDYESSRSEDHQNLINKD
jgi:hypothetical protein